MLTQETQSPMTNYLSVYGSGETLSLPRPIRVYFDCHAHEWNDCSTERKLFDLGYVQSQGYDIRADIRNILDNHQYINDSEIKRSLAILMAELKGCNVYSIEDEFKSASLDEMIDSFLEELNARYILPTTGNMSELGIDRTDGKHYLIQPYIKTADEDILKANRWCEVADKCGDEALYSYHDTYVYPGDEDIIEAYNEKASEETRFMTNTLPYPFQGNPLTAKVVILSLNPGYLPRVNDYFAKILRHYSQLTEGVMIFMRRNLRLNEERFMPRPERCLDEHPNYQDAYNMLGDWYWYDILSKWEKEGLTMEELMPKVALIQNIAYSSIKAKDLPKGAILPSQLYVKKMIRHIADNKNAIFVVPRAVKKWKALLGSTWTRLEEEGRIVIGRNPINQHLTEKNLGTENYKKIINHLKS